MALDQQGLDLNGFRDFLLENRRSPNTIVSYCCALRAHGYDLSVFKKRLSSSVLRLAKASQKMYAVWIGDNQRIRDLALIRIPNGFVRERGSLDSSQFESVVESFHTLGSPYRQVLIIQAMRGIRVGDILRTTRAEIDRAVKTNKLIFTSKGNKKLQYSVGRISDYLQSLLDINDRWRVVIDLFAAPGPRRESRARDKIRYALGKVAASNPDISRLYNHILRRTYAKKVLNALHGDPNAINKLTKHMGWSSPIMAMHYTDDVDAESVDQIMDEL